MTIQLENKKNDETEHLPIKNIYINKTYHKCKSILPLNKKASQIRITKKIFYQAINVKIIKIKIPHCRNGSKIQYQNRGKRENRYL